MFPSYIDVRNLALAHIKALTVPAANNKRFLISGMPFTYTAIARAIKDLVAKDRLPAEVATKLAKKSGEDQRAAVARIKAGKGNEALGMTFRSLEETVGDMALRILDIKQKSG
jgi:nucleoside-diphosphate-sugar epimerase